MCLVTNQCPSPPRRLSIQAAFRGGVRLASQMLDDNEASCLPGPEPHIQVTLSVRGIWVRAEAGPSLVLSSDLDSSALLASLPSSVLLSSWLWTDSPALSNPFPSRGTPNPVVWRAGPYLWREVIFTLDTISSLHPRGEVALAGGGSR